MSDPTYPTSTPSTSDPAPAQPAAMVTGQPGQPPAAGEGRPVFSAPPEPPALPQQYEPYHFFYRTPRWKWWRGLVGLVFYVFLFVIVSQIIALPALAYEFSQNPQLAEDLAQGTFNPTDLLENITPSIFLVNNLALASAILISWLVARLIFGQRPGWLHSVVGKFRWGWFGKNVLVMVVLYGLMFAIAAVLSPIPELSWKPYSLFMIFAILLTTPLQAAGEEFMLRGFTLRVLASWIPGREVAFWLASVLSSVVFMLLHGAGDVFLNIFYFTFGMAACWVVRMTGGLEATIAWHVVNNVSAMIILPFVDFSDMFNRSAGTTTGADAAVQAVTVAVSLTAMLVLAWRAKPQRQGIDPALVSNDPAVGAPQAAVSGPAGPPA